MESDLQLNKKIIGFATSHIVTLILCIRLALFKIMLIRWVLVNKAETVMEKPMELSQGMDVHARVDAAKLTRP